MLQILEHIHSKSFLHRDVKPDNFIMGIGPNSKLSEIGSSAFRQCYSLQNITIPTDTYVNERAFKESPTTVNRYGSVNNNFNY